MRPLILALISVMIFPKSALASDRCRVTDPTGTPLNLRDTPNGTVLGSIRNGLVVFIRDGASDEQGRPWVLISFPTGTTLGWVFREFISCY